LGNSVFKAYNALLQPITLPPGVQPPNQDQCTSVARDTDGNTVDCDDDATCIAVDRAWFCGTIGQFDGKCVEVEPATCPCTE
jgi:hypothetical protein